MHRLNFLIFFSALIVIFMYSSTLAVEKYGYISDELVVSIKDSTLSPQQTLGYVRSNDRVQILQETGKFSKIQFNGITGWIKSQYISPDLPKIEQITQLKQELQACTNKLSSSDTQIAKQDDSSNNDYSKQIHKLKEQAALYQDEIDKQIATIESLQKENDDLRESSQQPAVSLVGESATSSAQCHEEVGQLQNEITQLKKKNAIYLFMTGAGIFLLGSFFGKMGNRRKSRFS